MDQRKPEQAGQTRRDFSKAMVTAAFGGMFAGALVGCGALRRDKKDKDKHACAGQNSCKGMGGCKSGDQGCAGKNTCKGKGGCKAGQNCSGKTSCKGKGSCSS